MLSTCVFRQQLGQAILLGLELLVAGDIVRTVATSPSLTSVVILTAIILIRTFPKLLAPGRDNRAVAVAKARHFRVLDRPRVWRAVRAGTNGCGE